MSSYRRMTDTLPTCMNCGAVLYGPYCSQCGQRTTERITWRGTLAEAWRRVRTRDSRWLRTLAALTVDPGRMIRRYLRGRRLPYVSPWLYAVATVAFCLAVVVWLTAELSAPGTPCSTLQSAPARTVFALSAASSLLVAAITALVQARLYAAHGLSWTETYVFQLFVFGHLALHQTLFAVLGAFASTIGLAALAVVIVLFLAFALSGFYRKGLLASLPAALLLATVQVAGVFVAGSLVRIALTRIG